MPESTARAPKVGAVGGEQASTCVDQGPSHNLAYAAMNPGRSVVASLQPSRPVFGFLAVQNCATNAGPTFFSLTLAR
jgi:hypothetical protein